MISNGAIAEMIRRWRFDYGNQAFASTSEEVASVRHDCETLCESDEDLARAYQTFRTESSGNWSGVNWAGFVRFMRKRFMARMETQKVEKQVAAKPDRDAVWDQVRARRRTPQGRRGHGAMMVRMYRRLRAPVPAEYEEFIEEEGAEDGENDAEK